MYKYSLAFMNYLSFSRNFEHDFVHTSQIKTVKAKDMYRVITR